jgi:hypothetical protein
MKVKEYYSSVSEQVLYEIALNPVDRCKHYYAFWVSVKEQDIKFLTMDEHVRIDKILQLHKRLHKRK